MQNCTSRRNFLKHGLIITVTLSGLQAFAQETPERKTIVLDPGHGMGNTKPGVYDPGAVHEGLHESWIALDQVQRIGRILQEKGFAVRYTRSDETTEVPLNARTDLANQSNADLFISLHVNSCEYPSARGVRTYHLPKDQRGKKLARAIQDSLILALSRNVKGFTQEYDGLRSANFRVLRATKMPAVLLEPGFISNQHDRDYLTRNQDIVAGGIVNGIFEYYGRF